MILPDVDLKPVLIPHHKGRKRLHLGTTLTHHQQSFQDQSTSCQLLNYSPTNLNRLIGSHNLDINNSEKFQLFTHEYFVVLLLLYDRVNILGGGQNKTFDGVVLGSDTD